LVRVHWSCELFTQYGLLASKANSVVHHARTRPFWSLSPINVVRPLRVRSSSGLVHAHGSPQLDLICLERKGTVRGWDRLSRTTNAGTRRHASVLKPRRRQSQPGPPDESTHSWSMLCRVFNQEPTGKLQTAVTRTKLVHMIKDLIADKIGSLSYRQLFTQPPPYQTYLVQRMRVICHCDHVED